MPSNANRRRRAERLAAKAASARKQDAEPSQCPASTLAVLTLEDLRDDTLVYPLEEGASWADQCDEADGIFYDSNRLDDETPRDSREIPASPVPPRTEKCPDGVETNRVPPDDAETIHACPDGVETICAPPAAEYEPPYYGVPAAPLFNLQTEMAADAVAAHRAQAAMASRGYPKVMVFTPAGAVRAMPTQSRRIPAVTVRAMPILPRGIQVVYDAADDPKSGLELCPTCAGRHTLEFVERGDGESEVVKAFCDHCRGAIAHWIRKQDPAKYTCPRCKEAPLFIDSLGRKAGPLCPPCHKARELERRDQPRRARGGRRRRR